jgi:TM2 domain-containing membrane protein YozV
MKRKLILTFLFLAGTVVVMNAQDVITKMDGEEISARIFEINADEVQYKRFDNESGPTYTLLKSDIYTIKYENGEVDSWRTLSGKRLSIDLSAVKEAAKETTVVPTEHPAPTVVESSDSDEDNPAPRVAIITKKNGEEISALIFEVNTDEIKYKKSDRESGPLYVIPKSEIEMINYGKKNIDPIDDLQESPHFDTPENIQEPAATATIEYRHKSPAVAFWLSFLYPGMGQFYNGQIGKGIVMASIGTASYVGFFMAFNSIDLSTFDEGNSTLLLVSSVVLVGTYLWSVIDAPVSAKAINRRNAALSWNLGNGNSLSLNPDVLCPASIKGIKDYRSPAYGLSLKFNF